MQFSVLPSVSYAQSSFTSDGLQIAGLLESATCDEYSAFQPVKSRRTHPSLLRTFPVYTSTFLCLAFLILSGGNHANGQAPLKIDLKTEAIDGTTTLKSSIKFQAEIKNETKEPFLGNLQWSLCDAQQNSLNKIDHPEALELTAGSVVSVVHDFSPPEAGFYFAKIILNSGQQKQSQLFRFGSNLSAIQSTRTAELDFETFWTETQAKLRKIDPHYRVTKQLESKDKN